MTMIDPHSAAISPRSPRQDPLAPSDGFVPRHVGPTDEDIAAMLETLGYESLDQLIDTVVPDGIRLDKPLDTGEPLTEHALLKKLKAVAEQNTVMTSMIGMGYHGTITPPVILRNILENPLWYTPYTPYQAEIAQGRLEALLNFQTMVSDLTALPLAGASLLDEATAAAEAMAMCHAIARGKKPAFIIADDCHPQTINVCRTRADSMGIELRVVDMKEARGLQSPGFGDVSGVLVQYPTTYGEVKDYHALAEAVHDAGGLLVCAADILALVLLKPPGEFGADIAVGSTQRFGVPMGFGGPHAAYIATHEKYARKMPGRIIGVSKDRRGQPALRLAIQTREQHIKRDKATSNICTAQVLLAVIAGMYAVWHGPEGLRTIARRVHGLTARLAKGLRDAGVDIANAAFFDTLTLRIDDADAVLAGARKHGINLRRISERAVGVSLDETTTLEQVDTLLSLFHAAASAVDAPPSPIAHRTSAILTHPVFNTLHNEHELLRYLTQLQSRDFSLAHGMIPLGSCTMKLNAAIEMIPVTWPQFGNLHPFAPEGQTRGYQQLFQDLEDWLAKITGFAAVSLQPNAGSQGEYAGLLAIRGYHHANGDAHRDVCLIPTSAHGTNPASAVIAGFRIVPVRCDEQGNIDVADLKAKAEQHRDRLAALMITYPSTHGVFEDAIVDICQTIHDHGGQVYMDGANMNAQVGLTSPGRIGADVCHLNLHKTFCIPHGGGGPGMGPIGVAKQLAPFLPGHSIDGKNAVSAAPYGSPSILPISWVYIALMGGAGLTHATKVAILNANYIAKRLSGHYDVLYTGAAGLVAHEGIIDCRPFEKSAGVTVEDIAKRLMDYGFHAPTMSWPVAGTLMIEPTESEPKAELDRFCDAMIAIRREIADIEAGRMDVRDNPLKNAPHPAPMLADDDWSHTYSRKQAAYPMPWLETPGCKFWPAVARIDNAHGDRHLVCTCPSVDELSDD